MGYVWFSLVGGELKEVGKSHGWISSLRLNIIPASLTFDYNLTFSSPSPFLFSPPLPLSPPSFLLIISVQVCCTRQVDLPSSPATLQCPWKGHLTLFGT